MRDYSSLALVSSSRKNVPLRKDDNVPSDELVQQYRKRQYLRSTTVTNLAVRKGIKGITWIEVSNEFSCRKKKTQRKLKELHSKRLLFTAQDLRNQGLELPSTFRNRKPQRYYATCIKSDIIEQIKKVARNVLVQPTGVRSTASVSATPPSNVMNYQRKQNFLDYLIAYGSTAPLYLHKIQLQFRIEPRYYNRTLISEESRSKAISGYVGSMTYVTFIYSPNGTAQVFIACSHSPFKIENDEDIDNLFSFLGRIRDRTLDHLRDFNEHIVPKITKWRLVGCDINKDVEISDFMQFTLPDIQLKDAGKVFRLYVKPSGDRAFYRIEESFSPSQNSSFSEALDNILMRTSPDTKLANKVLQELGQLNSRIDSITTSKCCNCSNLHKRG